MSNNNNENNNNNNDNNNDNNNWWNEPLCQPCLENTTNCICDSCIDLSSSESCFCLRKKQIQNVVQQIVSNQLNITDTMIKSCHCEWGRLGHNPLSCRNMNLKVKLRKLISNSIYIEKWACNAVDYLIHEASQKNFDE